MLIDHVGAFLFPSIGVLRVIGRISFVLFAFQCVESMTHTSRKIKYILTLLICDIIMVLGAYLITLLFSGKGMLISTTFSTLGIGALTIFFLQKDKVYLKIIAVLPFLYALFSSFNFTPFNIDYGIYGVILIVGLYLVKQLTIFISKKQCIINGLNYDEYVEQGLLIKNYTFLASTFVLLISLVIYYFQDYFTTYFPSNGLYYAAQSNAFIAIPFILLYTGKRGYSSKLFNRFCYLFYPLNVVVIFLISYLF